jgi:hypothetical protein
VGGIRERRVAKVAERKPIRPRTLEVKEVDEVKDSEGEPSAELSGEFVGAAELVES